MSRRQIAVVATLDTKSGEARFLADLVEGSGFGVLVVDVGLSPTPQGAAAVASSDIARLSGTTLGELRHRRRDEAMRAMGEGAGRFLLGVDRQGDLAAAVGIGGNQGTAIASIALRTLPFRVPKVIVSTVASGDVRPFVGDSDIVMFFSVGDLLGGPNAVTEKVMRRAVGAVVGMVGEEGRTTAQEAPLVAMTAFGNTHRAVMRATARLETAHVQAVPFHASGACGSAMERLIEEGMFSGVLDLTTHELLGELFPEDIYAPVRPGRLNAAGEAGIPLVVLPGGMEYFCFGPPDTVPERLRDRAIHHHNPFNVNVRTTREELSAVAELMAQRLNAAHGPAAVIVPRHGWSEIGSPGGALHDPAANQGLVQVLWERLEPRVPVYELDAAINDPEVADFAVEKLLAMLRGETEHPRLETEAPGI